MRRPYILGYNARKCPHPVIGYNELMQREPEKFTAWLKDVEILCQEHNLDYSILTYATGDMNYAASSFFNGYSPLDMIMSIPKKESD